MESKVNILFLKLIKGNSILTLRDERYKNMSLITLNKRKLSNIFIKGVGAKDKRKEIKEQHVHGK